MSRIIESTREYRDNIPLVALVVADLIPLWGVFYQGWDAFIILLIYWSENLVVGFYNILRMVFVKIDRSGERFIKMISIPFFTFHYGAFCGVHGFFLLIMFRKSEFNLLDSSDAFGPLVFIQILINVIREVHRILPEGFLIPFIALAVSHGISFINNYLGKEEYKQTNIKQLMGIPYNRVIVMHVAVIAGGFLMVLLGSPAGLLVALVMVKIILNTIFHLREHSKLQKKGSVLNRE